MFKIIVARELNIKLTFQINIVYLCYLYIPLHYILIFYIKCIKIEPLLTRCEKYLFLIE